eukprot:3113681-Prymnesium_polylepis.1
MAAGRGDSRRRSRASRARWGSCGGLPRSAHAPCELGELESLETSVALAVERVGRAGLSRNPPRAGGGGESGETVAAKGRVGCSGARGPLGLGVATPAELGPSGAKQR